MEAVVRDFGDRNPQEDPVIHFYELFLKEYDAKKRMQRGVFYTPRPVVSYIVRSVHELLQTEFGLEDGLADTTTWGEMAERHRRPRRSPRASSRRAVRPDPRPRHGHRHVPGRGHRRHPPHDDGEVASAGPPTQEIATLWNEYVPKHLLPRLHGYELLMAPYAIAHLKIGLKLHETGYRFGSDERARVYLTNALEPAHDFSGQLRVRHTGAWRTRPRPSTRSSGTQRFTVVIGNPPYSVTSLNTNPFIDTLMKDYKQHVRGEKGLVALADDYLKFIRISQLQLRQSGCGVWGMITNHGYLRGVIHRGVRRELLDQFRSLVLFDLHGDTNVGELHRAVRQTKTSLTYNRGLRSRSAAKPKWPSPANGCYMLTAGELVPRSTRLSRSGTLSTIDWGELQPCGPGWLFIPFDDAHLDEYGAFPSLTEMMPVHSCGVKTHRDGFLIGYSKNEVIDRFKDVASGRDLRRCERGMALRIRHIGGSARRRRRSPRRTSTGMCTRLRIGPSTTAGSTTTRQSSRRETRNTRR